ncbi:MAG: hypothetical protein PHP00_15215 [Thiotrichaceae bacterium]|nr:hypothetical protein [Thiotrichaceae bacterium]
MRYFLGILMLALCCSTVSAAEITASDVYVQALRVNDEIKILKRHFNITDEAAPPTLTLSLNPRHVWQKTYEILYKINILREKIGMASLSIPSRQPLLNVSPAYPYEQILRILTEIDIIKRHLEITEKTELSTAVVTGKTPTDNFNVLNKISVEMDFLNGSSFTPNNVFSQVMRVLEDVNMLLERLEIRDSTIPPAVQAGTTPQDVFNTGITLLEEIRKVQLLAGMDTIDVFALKSFYKTATPSEVFGLMGIALAELQTLKGYLGLKYMLTPPARHYENIAPPSVQQVAGWAIRKLRLIKMLNRTTIKE